MNKKKQEFIEIAFVETKWSIPKKTTKKRTKIECHFFSVFFSFFFAFHFQKEKEQKLFFFNIYFIFFFAFGSAPGPVTTTALPSFFFLPSFVHFFFSSCIESFLYVYRLLPGFTAFLLGFNRVLLRLNGFEGLLLGFTGFLLGFTGL